MSSRANVQAKQMPKEAQTVITVLREMNVDYEPRVVLQLLHFCYGYVTTVLDEAKEIAQHARKKNIDMDDVKLALEFVLDKSYTRPPPREIVAKLSETRNSMPLPLLNPPAAASAAPMYWHSHCKLPMKVMNRSALTAQSMLRTKSWQAAQNRQKPLRRPLFTTQAYTELTIPKPIIEIDAPPVHKTANTVEILDDERATSHAIIDLDMDVDNKTHDMEVQLIDINAAMSTAASAVVQTQTTVATTSAAAEGGNLSANAVAVANMEAINERVALKRKHNDVDDI